MHNQQYCKYCGASVDSDAVYCSHCGKNITSASSSAITVDTDVKTPRVVESAPVAADTKLIQKLDSPEAIASILLGIVALFFTLLVFYVAVAGAKYARYLG